MPRKSNDVRHVSRFTRSEEHTSELQSQSNLVCRLLLEKKNHAREQPPHLAMRRPQHTLAELRAGGGGCGGTVWQGPDVASCATQLRSGCICPSPSAALV